jgi:hypothetical protein
MARFDHGFMITDRRIATSVGVCAVALLGIFPALGVAGNPPVSTPQTPPAQRNRGTLQLTQESFDFGHVAQNTRVTHSYVLKNTGTDTLFINKVHATCGCTSAPLTKDKLAPGERVPIDVTFSSGKMSGHVRKTVTIYSSDGKQPQTSLDFTATVGALPNVVTYEPGGGIDLSRFASGASAQGKVALTNLGTGGANLKVVSTAPAFLEASFSVARIEPRQMADLIVKTKQGAPVGRFAGSVTVMLEGGANARLSIPVTGESTAD